MDSRRGSPAPDQFVGGVGSVRDRDLIGRVAPKGRRVFQTRPLASIVECRRSWNGWSSDGTLERCGNRRERPADLAALH